MIDFILNKLFNPLLYVNRGRTGSMGGRGMQGATGLPGRTGATGFSGPRGETGEKGGLIRYYLYVKTVMSLDCSVISY